MNSSEYPRLSPTRRQFFELSAAAGALLVIGGCTSGTGGTSGSSGGTGTSGSGTPGKASQSANNAEKATLRMLVNTGDYRKGHLSYNQVNGPFKQQHQNITIDANRQPGENWRKTFFALVSAGNLPDVAEVAANFTLQNMLSGGWALPLDDLPGLPNLRDRYPAESFVDSITTSGGKLYTFKTKDTRGTFLEYNQAVLKKAGLDPNSAPKTWDELETMADAVVKKAKVAGLALPGKIINGYDFFLQSANAGHPGIVDGFNYRTGHYDYSTALSDAVPFMLMLRDKGLLIPGFVTLGIDQALGKFSSSQAGFSAGGSFLAQSNVLLKFKDYGVTSLPVPASGQQPLSYGTLAGGEYYAMTSTKYKSQIAELFDFLSSEEYLNAYVKGQSIPVTVPKINENKSNITVPQLGQIIDAQKLIVVPPIPGRDHPGVQQAQQAEAKLPPPQPDWWQIMQGAYIGKISDWQGALKKVDDTYNANFDKAIEQAKSKGGKVSRSDFTFDSWSGTANYKP